MEAKERIELLVTVDIYFDEYVSRDKAIDMAKRAVLACRGTYTEPRKADMIEREKR